MRDVAGLYVNKVQYGVRRTLLVFKKGFWFFPGGKHERGEELYGTLVRELREELGMSLSSGACEIHRGVFPAPGHKDYRFVTFTCKPECLVGTPCLQADDTVTDWAWVDRPWELNLTPHARFIVERFGR